MNSIQLKAYAKVNLGLDVLRKREDGYHDVKMIMQTVNLYDIITITTTKESTIELTCSADYLKPDENNLVYKSAKLMKDTYQIPHGFVIHLEKNIPIAAGLAGGSADAAATLDGINQLCNLNLSKETLMKLGVTLGADIPYCILKGTALSEGIGEKLTVLPPFPSCHVVLVKPPINVSTKYVYENLKLDVTTIHPDIDGIIERMKDNDLLGASKKFHNVLEDVTVYDYPIIQDIKKELLSLGAVVSLMSGSGPTVFALFSSYETAKSAYLHMLDKNITKEIYLTEFYHQRIEK